VPIARSDSKDRDGKEGGAMEPTLGARRNPLLDTSPALAYLGGALLPKRIL
jgi:hypothetical protein